MHAGEGNMEMYPPKNIIFPEGNAWVYKCSHFLNPHAINVLIYRMKPGTHIHVK